MNTITALSAFKDNYIWLISDLERKAAICIDPGDAMPVIEALTDIDCRLAAILITHHHWDHTNGLKHLKEYFDVPVYGPAIGQLPGVTHPCSDGDKVEIPELGLAFKVMQIPGHTLDHIAFYGDKRLFCGDTLFAAGCGRLFEGTAQNMVDSLASIAKLPKKTKIYPAHEYTITNLRFAETVEPSNIDIPIRLEKMHALRQESKPTLPVPLEDELATNPFLRIGEPKVKASICKHANEKLTEPAQLFSCLRRWKDAFI
jgi:hydroxyacylglutathione hydrolase